MKSPYCLLTNRETNYEFLGDKGDTESGTDIKVIYYTILISLNMDFFKIEIGIIFCLYCVTPEVVSKSYQDDLWIITFIGLWVLSSGNRDLRSE